LTPEGVEALEVYRRQWELFRDAVNAIIEDSERQEVTSDRR
jgi:DNA-binding PadR family transcriptional regulator